MCSKRSIPTAKNLSNEKHVKCRAPHQTTQRQTQRKNLEPRRPPTIRLVTWRQGVLIYIKRVVRLYSTSAKPTWHILCNKRVKTNSRNSTAQPCSLKRFDRACKYQANSIVEQSRVKLREQRPREVESAQVQVTDGRMPEDRGDTTGEEAQMRAFCGREGDVVDS